MSFPAASPAAHRAGAFVHKRLDAALPVTTFPFSGSTQAYTKSRGNGSGRHTVIRRTISSRPLGVSSAFLWLFTLFLARLLVYPATSNVSNAEKVNTLSEHNS